jgi:tripartite-type tricarboxylate transporter receptor subunit TctC
MNRNASVDKKIQIGHNMVVIGFNLVLSTILFDSQTLHHAKVLQTNWRALEETTMSISSRREILAGIGASAIALTSGSSAQAQAWPQRPINVIMPLQAGSASDIAVRIAGEALGQRLGQNLIVENVTGAAGLLGATRAARAQPDGYTLGAFNNSILTIMPNIRAKKPDFDSFADFMPIVGVANIPTYLGVHQSVPAKTVAELITYLKSKNGEVTCATGGPGSPQHLAAEMFMALTGTKMTQVPYRGATAAATDLAGGHSQVMFIAHSLYLPFEQTGNIRLLGFCGPTRSAALPNMATLDEQGVKGFDYSSWLGFFAIKGTPPDILERLRKDAFSILNAPISEKLTKAGLEPWFKDHVQLADIMKADDIRWKQVIKAANLSLD